MRPPEFTGGNTRSTREFYGAIRASMRPPEFTGGNCRIGVLYHEWRAALQ